MLRTGAVVNLDARFRTISDADPNAQGFDSLARRRSLVAIGMSPANAYAVLEMVGHQLGPELATPEDLGRAVTVSMDGDVILVEALTNSPEQSALIANTWAGIIVGNVNEIFAESALTTDSLESQALVAKKDYDAKQAAIIAFIDASRVEQLSRERDLLQSQLNSSTALQAKLLRVQFNAEGLRKLIQEGRGDVTSSQEFAKFLFEVNAFNSEGEQPFRIDIPFDQSTRARPRSQVLAELDEFLETLKDQQAALGGEANAPLYEQLSDLNVQLEQAAAQRKELEAERDLAWNTFQLINTKVAENTIATETESQLVRVASPAIEPREPVEQRTLLKTLLGGMAGAVVGAALALVMRPR
jgi:capsular polysaccharide biosynthesis protein